MGQLNNKFELVPGRGEEDVADAVVRERKIQHDMNSYLKLEKKEEITQIQCHQKTPGTPFLREWTTQHEDDENRVNHGDRVS